MKLWNKSILCIKRGNKNLRMKDKMQAQNPTNVGGNAATFDLQAALSTLCSLMGEHVITCRFILLAIGRVHVMSWDECQAGRGSC